MISVSDCDGLSTPGEPCQHVIFKMRSLFPLLLNISNVVGVICLVKVVLCVAVNLHAQNQINHIELEA